MIRLLLADDQALVRGAIASLLDLEEDLEVVAQVGRGDEVVVAARASEADVALLDVEMPGLDGIGAARALRAEFPSCRALIVTTFGRPGYVRIALEAGASGFVVKDTPSGQLADAVRRVAAGHRVVDPALAAESLAAGPSPLSARETDVRLTLRPSFTSPRARCATISHPQSGKRARGTRQRPRVLPQKMAGCWPDRNSARDEP
jgi:two-component system response regulator DesR